MKNQFVSIGEREKKTMIFIILFCVSNSPTNQTRTSKNVYGLMLPNRVEHLSILFYYYISLNVILC